jgi:hypothetical protein
MTTDAEALRREIDGLYTKRAEGDLTEKAFQRDLSERTVDLYRKLIQGRLSEEEAIQAEHHVVKAHMKVTQSVLREPEQEAISLFATDRRLFRLRSTLTPDRPPTGDRKDGTTVDEMPYLRIDSLKLWRQIRLGEMGVGAGMCCFALLFSSWLSVTGPFMAGLGLLGMLHGLVLPTRWVEVIGVGPEPASGPILIYALRKKSARRLVRYIREKIKREAAGVSSGNGILENRTPN